MIALLSPSPYRPYFNCRCITLFLTFDVLTLLVSALCSIVLEFHQLRQACYHIGKYITLSFTRHADRSLEEPMLEQISCDTTTGPPQIELRISFTSFFDNWMAKPSSIRREAVIRQDPHIIFVPSSSFGSSQPSLFPATPLMNELSPTSL